MYRVTKVISAALLAFIIVTAVTVGLGSMADDEVILVCHDRIYPVWKRAGAVMYGSFFRII